MPNEMDVGQRGVLQCVVLGGTNLENSKPHYRDRIRDVPKTDCSSEWMQGKYNRENVSGMIAECCSLMMLDDG